MPMFYRHHSGREGQNHLLRSELSHKSMGFLSLSLSFEATVVLLHLAADLHDVKTDTDTSHKKGHSTEIHKSEAFPPGESARLLFKEKCKHLISIRQHRRGPT